MALDFLVRNLRFISINGSLKKVVKSYFMLLRIERIKRYGNRGSKIKFKWLKWRDEVESYGPNVIWTKWRF